MNLLALDTSSIACSVASQVDDRTIYRYEERPREHTRLLLPMIREVLTASGTKLKDYDALVLGNGPGSFIGVRIAAAACQGLAFAAGKHVIPVSSLAAVASRAFRESNAERIAVAQDARMNEVYFCAYAKSDENLPIALCAERLQGITRIDDLENGQYQAAGAGWQRYPELLALNAGCAAGPASTLYPDARDMLALADVRKAVDPQQIQPAYLRNEVARPAGR